MNGSAVRLGIIGMGPANMASTMFGTEIFVVVSLFLLSKFLVPKTLLQEDPDLCYPLTDHQNDSTERVLKFFGPQTTGSWSIVTMWMWSASMRQMLCTPTFALPPCRMAST